MRKLLLTIAASALMATGAIAADPVITVEPAYVPEAGFDWDGFYMGVGITGLALNSGTNVGFADLIAGVNMTAGDVLFGVEGWLGGWATNIATSGWGGGAEARLGYLVTPDALIYASGGGYMSNLGDQLGTVGAGAEFVLTDNVTVDIEYKYWFTSIPVDGHSLGLSALWHF